MKDPCGAGDTESVREHEERRSMTPTDEQIKAARADLSKVGWALQCADAGSGKAIKIIAAAYRQKEAEAASAASQCDALFLDLGAAQRRLKATEAEAAEYRATLDEASTELDVAINDSDEGNEDTTRSRMIRVVNRIDAVLSRTGAKP
jgi:hypothetical protein